MTTAPTPPASGASVPAASSSGSARSRKFGLWSITLLVINSIIGTGIFLTPGSVIKVAGTWTPLVYVLAGVLACVLALVFASAAKYVTDNGASYAYTRRAFGPGLGFYVGITRFVAGSIAWGVMATAVVKTTLGIVAGKAAAASTLNVTIGFLLLMGVLLAINLGGTALVRWFNNIATAGKVLALVFAIVAGLVIVIATGHNHFGDVANLRAANGSPLVKPMTTTVFVGAVMSAFYAFTGFESAATASSEFENPERNVPRAIPVAIGVVTAVYVGVVTIAMMVNPTDVLKTTMPVALAAAFTNPVVQGIIVLGAVLSMFGINVAASFSTPRILDAIAEQGQVPSVLCRKNSRGVPVLAFAVTAAFAVAVPLAFQYDMKGIMVISSVSRFVQFLVVPAAVIAFYFGRSREPILDARRNWFTDVAMAVLGFALSLFLLVKLDWNSQFSVLNAAGAPTGQLNWWAVGAMLVGYVVLPLALYIPYRMGRFHRPGAEQTPAA